MGGAERVERQHASGPADGARADRAAASTRARSTRRARSPARGEYEDGELAGFLPANVVIGQGRIEGRRPVVQGDDFTVRGGAADAAIWQKMVYAERLANELRLPLVRLVDGTGGGGSVKSLETDGLHVRALHPRHGRRGREPLRACRWSRPRSARWPGSARRASSPPTSRVIVRGTAQLFVAGPPVVAAAMGEAPDKEELGGSRAQTRAGAVDNEAADEDDALDQLKRFLSYLPPNVWEPPPVIACQRPGATGARRAALDRPARPRASPTHARTILEAVFDRGSVFELGARYGRPLITALARLDGRPVGVLALGPQALRRRADRRRLGEARRASSTSATSSACRSSTSSTSPAS